MPQQIDVKLIPAVYAEHLPTSDFLDQVLSASAIELPAGQPLIRAAWNQASLWPIQVNRTYRFGPPDELAGSDGRFPFHWLYAADEVFTAAWEARVCVNDVTRPGTFQFAPGAERVLIATLSCTRPLRLLDLSGDSASKLGIYDQLRGPDYGFCQWLGYVLDGILVRQAGAFDGFRYPSRRHPGRNAYAISSRAMDALAPCTSITTTAFGDTEAYGLLERDPCWVPAL